MEVSVAVGGLGVGILSRSDLLISFSREVDVKGIEGLVFDVVGVLVALAIVTAKSKKLV